MPFFAAFLIPVFEYIFNFFVFRFAGKFAALLVYVGILSALTLTFYLGLTALVKGFALLIPDSWLRMYFYVLLPSNFTTCITFMFAAEVGSFIYRYQVKVLMLASGL